MGQSISLPQSGLTLLTKGSVSGVGSFDIKDVFNGPYSRYKITFDNFLFTSPSNIVLYASVNNGVSFVSTATYQVGGFTSSNAGVITGKGFANATGIDLNLQVSINNTSSMVLDLEMIQNGTGPSFLNWEMLYTDLYRKGWAFNSSIAAFNALRFHGNGQTFSCNYQVKGEL